MDRYAKYLLKARSLAVTALEAANLAGMEMAEFGQQCGVDLLD